MSIVREIEVPFRTREAIRKRLKIMARKAGIDLSGTTAKALTLSFVEHEWELQCEVVQRLEALGFTVTKVKA